MGRAALVQRLKERGAELGFAAAEKLDDGEPVVRATAAWAIGRAGGGKGGRLLRRARDREKDAAVRAEIETALDARGAAAGAAVHGVKVR